MIELIPSSGAVIDAANPVNWSHPSMQPGVRPVAWYLAIPGLMGGARWHNLMSPADLSIGNHGTLTGIAQSSSSGWQQTNRPGGFGEMLLDGTDDCISTPVVVYRPFTITLWMCPSLVANTATSRRIASNTDTTKSSGGDQFTLRINNQKIEAWSSTWSVVTSSTLTANNRYHFAFSVMPNGSASAYLNGVFEGSSFDSYAISRLGIGSRFFYSGNSIGEYYAGLIDDVQLYPRPLTGFEIRNRYLASLAGYPGELNRINTVIAPPTGSGLLLQRRRAA